MDFQPRHVIVNETYPADCIKSQVLLPVHHIRFRVVCDVSESAAEAQSQQIFEDTRNPASNALIVSAAPESVSATAQHDNGHEEPDGVGRLSFSMDASEELGTGAFFRNSDDQEGDALDMIVAEVKETAELVNQHPANATKRVR